MPKPAEKRLRVGHVKSIDTKTKRITALVSTFDWDRTGERLERGAWNLKNYEKNPVVFWGHRSWELPIGKAVELTETAEGLLAVTEFDQKSERAMEIFDLFDRGFLNAWSVGFLPDMSKTRLEPIEGTNGKGMVFLSAELLEYSAVSIPANPGAVVGRQMADLVTKALGEGYCVPAPSGNPDEFVVQEVSPVEIPEPEKPAEKSIGESLSALLEVVKVARGQKVDKTTLSAMGQAVNLFNEIIADNSEHVSEDDFNRLKAVVSDLGSVIQNLYPDAAEVVRRIMSQVNKAVEGRAA